MSSFKGASTVDFEQENVGWDVISQRGSEKNLGNLCRCQLDRTSQFSNLQAKSSKGWPCGFLVFCI